MHESSSNTKIKDGFTLTSMAISNLLAIILPLHNIPKLQEDINEFYFPHLSTAPSTPAKKAKKVGQEDAPSTQPSWMDFFDSDSDASSEEERYEVDKATGKKKKVKKSKAGKGRDVLSSVWSVESQRKVFGDCWSGVMSLPYVLSLIFR